MTNAPATTNDRTRPCAGHGRATQSAVFIGVAVLLSGCGAAQDSGPDTNEGIAMQQTPSGAVRLTEEWDKTFPKSDRVDYQKVTFKNRYGITLALTCTCRRTALAGGWRHWLSAVRLAL